MEITTLPEPFGWLEPTGRSPAFHFLRRNKEDGMPVFTADQLRAYAEAAVRAEREECAKEAEKWQEIVTAAIRSRT